MIPDIFENLRLELRRGCLILAVLAALRTERYGYTLRKSLADQGMEIDEGTLYPLLRRWRPKAYSSVNGASRINGKSGSTASQMMGLRSSKDF